MEVFSYTVLSEDAAAEEQPSVLQALAPLLFVNQQVRQEAGDIFFRSMQMALPCQILSALGQRIGIGFHKKFIDI